MKKRVIAVLVGAFLAFNTFGDLMVTAAGESAEEIEEFVEDEEIEEEDGEESIDIPTDENDETVSFSLSDLDNGFSDDFDLDQALRTSLAEDVPEGANLANPEDENALINSVKIYKGDSELQNGDAISFNDNLQVKYYLNTPIMLNNPDLGNGVLSINAGTTYKLPKLNVAALSIQDTTIDVPIEGHGNLGTLTIDAEGNVSLAVTNTKELQLTEIDPLVISFQIDSAAVNGAEEYELDFFGKGNKYKLVMSDNKAIDPKITTTAEANDGEQITWKATIKNDVNPKVYSDGYTFVATLSKDQILDKDSFTYAGNSVNASDLSISTDADGNTIVKYVIPAASVNNNSGATTDITYKTTVDFIGNGGASAKTPVTEKTVTNKVKLVTNDTAEDVITSDDTGSKAVRATKFIPGLAKSINNTDGKFENDSKNNKGVGHWTITVNTNGYHLKNLKIYDNLIPGDNSTKFVTDFKSIKVTKDGSTLDNFQLEEQSGTTTNGKNYSWYITIADAPAGSTYVIKYDTYIDNYTQYLRTNHTVAPKNEAFMTYEYEKGTGEWTPVEGPSIDATSAITSNAGISVSTSTGAASTYDPATHRITWWVTVNKEKQRLKGARIENVIPKTQKYISSNFSQDKITVTDDNHVAFDIGDAADEKTITFNVVTELMPGEVNFWSKNATETYENKFTLSATELGEDTLTVNPTCKCESDVIKITAGKYNYDTHTIDYTIDINNNQMLMEGISVIDELSSKDLELVGGTVKLNGATLSENSEDVKYYTYSNGTLTVHDDNVESGEVGTSDAKSQIKFTAKVTDAKLNSITTNSKIETINNTAKLITNDISESGESVSAKTEFTNNVVLKDATINEDTNVASYVVTFNANQMLLPELFEIRDTLGASMDLDVSSVKLYVGTVNPDTGVITKASEEVGYTVSAEANADGKTVMSVKLPKNSNNKNAYYLTYEASAVDFEKNDYDNQVQLIGYANKSFSVTNAKAKVLAKFSAKASTSPKLIITDVDADDNNVKLGSSTFEVRDSAGNLIRTLVTKADGTVKAIGGKLKNGEIYTVTQKTVKDGYIRNENEFTVTITDNNGQVDVKNKKQSKAIAINKEDGQGNAVSGASLKIDWADSTGNKKTAGSWTTDGTSHSFNASYGVEYTLTETATPFGYNSASPIKFKVEDGVLYVNDGSSYNPVDDGVITMIDSKKGVADFKVKLVSDETGDGLEGGEFVISEKQDGSNPINSWKTNGGFETFTLPDGDYYIVEKSAPTGYIKSAATKINVENGTVENPKIIIPNGLDPNKKATFVLSPETLGIDPSIFKQMKIQVFKYNYDPTDAEEAESFEPVPFTEDPETGKQTYDLNYQEDYVIRQTEDVPGYRKIDPITVRLVAKEDTVTPVNPGVNPVDPTDPADPADTTGDVVKIKNPDGMYIPKTIEELGKTVTPQPVPVVVNNNGGEPEHHHYYGPAKPVAKDELKDKEITALANTDAAASNGGRLAKTGGFLGTLTGYLAAALLILVGAYLVFGNRKRVK